MKANRILLQAVLALAFAVAACAASYPVQAAPGLPALSANHSGASVPGPHAPNVILYNQTDNAAGNGAPDQNFETANDIYDSEGADDFIITDPYGWDISEIDTVGSYGGTGAGVSTVNVTIYADSGGMPGAAVATRSGITPVDTAGSFVITITPAIHLDPGTYWLSVQTNLSYDPYGQHFWSNRSTQSNNESCWRNPGGGFGTSCTAWGRQRTCNVGGGLSPDFLFQIQGTISSAPIPSANIWGLGALVVLLAGAGLFVRKFLV